VSARLEIAGGDIEPEEKEMCTPLLHMQQKVASRAVVEGFAVLRLSNFIGHKMVPAPEHNKESRENQCQCHDGSSSWSVCES
jgi:hypothetical protein